MITRGPARARSFADGRVLLNVQFQAEAGGFSTVAAMFDGCWRTRMCRMRLRAWLVDCVESPDIVVLWSHLWVERKTFFSPTNPQ